MSNWLFLMLLYGFFGWMKKRQRDKARDKIESQDDWDNGGIVDFGEGILEAIMGDENSGIEKPKTILKEDILLRPKPFINLNHCLTDNALQRVPASSKNTFAVIDSRDV